jgi:hypothetical protein
MNERQAWEQVLARLRDIPHYNYVCVLVVRVCADDASGVLAAMAARIRREADVLFGASEGGAAGRQFKGFWPSHTAAGLIDEVARAKRIAMVQGFIAACREEEASRSAGPAR